MLFKIFLAMFVCTQFAFAQNTNITGKLLDNDTKSPLIGSTVVLMDKDSVAKYHDLTDKKGSFEIKDVQRGFYILKITYISYKPYFKPIRVNGKDNINLGDVLLQQAEVKTKQVEVTGKAPIGEQKNDTTELNANSFKTLPDANTEDLVKKMPGIQVDQSGSVKAQGEDVKKVLVDGKPFFGDDPTAALRNLPADVVDKVQVYDKMSEQSEFTGFDDGQTVKTMNIITKRNRRNGQFGKLSSGYGDQTRYNIGLNANFFDNDRRVSILGMSNNVNQQNFSLMDILDAMGGGGPQGQMFRSFAGRGGPGGGSQMRPPSGASGGGGGFFGGGGRGFGGGLQNFFVGQQDGINTTHALGGNYSDNWGESIDVTGSYFFNNQKNSNIQDLYQNYFPTDSIRYNYPQSYLQNSGSSSNNINHRFNFRFNYQIDTNNTILIKPSLNYQLTNTDKTTTGVSRLLSGQNLDNTSNSNTDYSGYNISNELLFKHRFGVVGRTVSIDFITGLNNKTYEWDLLSNLQNLRSNGNIADSLVKQTSTSPTDGYTLNANIAYTEPIHENGQLMFSYNANYNSTKSDKQTFNWDTLSKIYDIMDTSLTNKFNNYYFYQRGGLGYRYKVNEINITASLDYQRAELNSNQDFPNDFTSNHRFYNLLPAVRINYRISQRTNFFLNYRTSINAPSISQLQDVVDNRNPLMLSTGNPNLRQQVTYNLSSRYSSFSEDFNHVFFSFFSVNYGTDYIGNSTVFQSDIARGITVPAGGQLIMPVNLNNYWFVIGMVNYGFPLNFISSKANINAGGNYTKTPSLISSQTNYSNAYNLNGMFLIASNFSNNLDFMISTRINYNQTANTLRQDQNYNYNSYLNYVSLKWIFWQGVFVQADLTNQFYTGIAPSNSNFTLLNFSIGKKLFDNDNGEIKLSVNDALNQNKSVQTSVTDLYTQNTYTNVLTRYVMLTFSYNLRRFGGMNQ